MAQKVELWRTTDGKLFNSEQEADEYQEYLDLLETIRSCVWTRHISVEEMAEWLWKHYDVAERLTSRTLPKKA